MWSGQILVSQKLHLKEIRAAALPLQLKLEEIEIEIDPGGVERAFQTATQKQLNALITTSARVISAEKKRIVELAAKSRLAAIYPGKEFVQAGGIMSYAPNYDDLYRRAASYVDRILKGAKPADLPVERPSKYEFFINLKAAKQIGLTVPPNVLARADRVIR